MKNEIHLLRNNDKKQLSDLELVDKFYTQLKDDLKLKPNKAFSIIYLLQEHIPVFPDHIEQCSVCKSLFDSYSAGWYSEKSGKHFCDGCLDYAPEKVEKRARYY